MQRPRRKYSLDRGTSGPTIIGQEPGLDSALGSMNLNSHCDTSRPLIIGQESGLDRALGSMNLNNHRDTCGPSCRLVGLE